MELSYKRLSDSEIADGLAKLPNWELTDGMLTRLFEFKSYKDGLVFATAVGYAADQLNHHPDLLIGYQKVRVSTITHDSQGLTSYDFELARRVEALAR